MKILISIETDNAAFTDYGSEEVARILRHLANEMEPRGIHAGDTINARDINGNTVGGLTVTETE